MSMRMNGSEGEKVEVERRAYLVGAHINGSLGVLAANLGSHDHLAFLFKHVLEFCDAANKGDRAVAHVVEQLILHNVTILVQESSNSVDNYRNEWFEMRG